MAISASPQELDLALDILLDAIWPNKRITSVTIKIEDGKTAFIASVGDSTTELADLPAELCPLLVNRLRARAGMKPEDDQGALVFAPTAQQEAFIVPHKKTTNAKASTAPEATEHEPSLALRLVFTTGENGPEVVLERQQRTLH